MTATPSICIAYLGNALNDTRINNLANSLEQDGIAVKVISFDWTTQGFKSIIGNRTVHKLTKTKFSLKYYLKFARILIKDLYRTKADIYIAEDIYTLPFVYYAAKFRRKCIYYNSRELYPFLAGLRNKKYVQLAIKLIERYFIKKVNLVLATGKMDAQFLEQYYKITNTLVIRNLPILKDAGEKINLREKFGIDKSSLILLYQGVILEGRGLKETITAIKDFEKIHLVVIGDGVKKQEYEKLTSELSLQTRVHFIGTVSQEELINYTSSADLGLALIKNISLSYYYALPNKLFEYIVAGIPVIVSDLPQMNDIVLTYRVGYSINFENECALKELLAHICENEEELKSFTSNLDKARRSLNWQIEYSGVKSLLLKPITNSLNNGNGK
ncbi:MAG: glycosyltransferase [Bacteroidetes bacterium]|nr:glycosyltransferase [Bacteroidota bacterium]MBU1677270.1 glycosyltransferase [Bacteroidota bacterium]MBU2508101.1 glycosyltransferase [Bacteroidota bacterium]